METGATLYWPVRASTRLPEEVTERKDEGEIAACPFSLMSQDSDM